MREACKHHIFDQKEVIKNIIETDILEDEEIESPKLP
jgi:hypothetical protein